MKKGRGFRPSLFYSASVKRKLITVSATPVMIPKRKSAMINSKIRGGSLRENHAMVPTKAAERATHKATLKSEAEAETLRAARRELAKRMGISEFEGKFARKSRKAGKGGNSHQINAVKNAEPTHNGIPHNVVTKILKGVRCVGHGKLPNGGKGKGR